MTYSGEREDKTGQDKAGRRTMRRQPGRKTGKGTKSIWVRNQWAGDTPDTVVNFSRRPFKDRMRLRYYAMPIEEFERTFGVALPRGEFQVKIKVQVQAIGRIMRPKSWRSNPNRSATPIQGRLMS